MHIYKFAKGMPNFAHAILPQHNWSYKVTDLQYYMPARCDTPRGNTTCTCGKYNMLWVNNSIQTCIVVHDAMPNTPARVQNAVVHISHDMWLHFDDTIFKTFISYQWQKFIGEIPQRELFPDAHAVIMAEYDRIASAVFEEYASVQQQSQRVNEYLTHDCPVCSNNCTCREFYTERFCNHSC